ncbi:hypothetical protein BDP27DRAFT_1336250 [Rhodocollybia butyracea]|uniref:Extracellular conserved serine-rich protein n=1 Tax=Rhodocollybia butyracea TaxID=206335 RepID=A0A9P5U1R3_9AGAR|nr:hypothetical protein BDP27DRAFT_1336250 [Rhodocollybia butyracea]
MKRRGPKFSRFVTPRPNHFALSYTINIRRLLKIFLLEYFSSSRPSFPAFLHSSLTNLEMFAKLCVVAAAIPLALGLTLNAPPANVTSGLVTVISWSATSTDSSFTLELFHPSFNNALALANNVDPSLGNITVEMPIVPADSGYTLEAVNIGNISDIFSTSPSFSIAQTPSTSVTATLSTTFTDSATTSGGAATTTPTSPGSTSSPGTGSTGSGSSSNTATSASTSASSGSFNGSGNGAMSIKSGNVGSFVAILAAIAGATMFL